MESDTSRTHTALETAYHQVTLCIVMGQNCMHRDPRKRPVLWDILDRLGEMGTSEESVTRGVISSSISHFLFTHEAVFLLSKLKRVLYRITKVQNEDCVTIPLGCR